MQHRNIVTCIIVFDYVLSFLALLAQSAAPVITIPDGQLEGTSNHTIRDSLNYYAYRGIPFAKKPIGNLRFAPPVKNDPWNGTLDATKDKDQCTQVTSPMAATSGVTVAGSEDCLYINVYTTNVNGSLPVMVWIYGGAFIGGSSDYETYGPDYFLEKGVVYVAFNYRLGIFGFLSTEDLEAPGNWGLKDQVLALKWVKRNIQYFGGDPNRVTIFGESAGAASVSYLVNSNLTQGLFEGAIMQSGTSLCSWALTRNSRLKAFKVGASLGFFSLSSQQLVQQLRTADFRRLKLAENNVTLLELAVGNLLGGLPFGVVKEPDHPGALFSSRSWELVKNGDFRRVPLIAGFNSEEISGFSTLIEMLRPFLLKYDIDKTLLAPVDLTPNFLKRTIAGYNISNYFFHLGSISQNATAFTRFGSFDLFVRPIRELVTLASKFTNTYYYEFSYKGLLGDPTGNTTGVAHAEELRYLFVTPNRTDDARDAETIEKFVTLWTNFAKTGNPTPQTATSNGTVLGQLTWTPNDTNSNSVNTIRYLQINDTLNMESNPLQADWNFYQNLYNRYGDPPYGTY